MPQPPGYYTPDPAVDVAALVSVTPEDTSGNADTTKNIPAWWSEFIADGIPSGALATRIVDDLLGDLLALPVQVGLQNGVVDEQLTGLFVGSFDSPVDSASSGWAQHCANLLVWGKSFLVEASNIEGEGLDQWAGSWIVYNPTKSTYNKGLDQWTLTHQSGRQFVTNGDRVKVCVWWDQTTPGLPRSVLSPLKGELQIVQLGEDAAYSQLENAQQALHLVEIAAGQVTTLPRKAIDPSQPAVESQGPTSAQAWLSNELTVRAKAKKVRNKLRALGAALVHSRSDNDNTGVKVVPLTPPVDTGVVALADHVLKTLAVAASIPASQLTGEQPKYANMFATREQFLRSQLGFIAGAVAAATGPFVREICGNSAVMWLDSSTVIEAAVVADSPLAAARFTRPPTPSANSLLGKKKVRALKKWHHDAIVTLRVIAEQVAQKVLDGLAVVAAADAKPFDATNVVTLKQRRQVAAILADLKRLGGQDLDEQDLDLLDSRAGSSLDALVSQVQTAGQGKPFDVQKSMVNMSAAYLATSLFGESTATGSGNPTLLDRPEVIETIPELAEGPIVWQVSWTPPGDPTRQEFHADDDGNILVEGVDDQEIDKYGNDDNGDACQCVLDLYEGAIDDDQV